MLTLITCPTCHQKFTIAEGSMGHRQTCPNCQSIFVAGKSVADGTHRNGTPPRRGLLERAADELPSKPAIDRTMLGEVAAAIRYNCPRCKKPLESPAIEAGIKKPCRFCGGRMQVPAPNVAPPTLDPGMNKTLLATEEGAPAHFAAAATHVLAPRLAAPPEKTAAEVLSPRARIYAIGGVAAALLLFALVYFVGRYNSGIEADKLQLSQRQELERLKLDIEQKTALLQQQQQFETQQRRLWEEQRTKQEAREREWAAEQKLELAKLAVLKDDKLAADAKANLERRQREIDDERKASEERRLKAERDTRDQIEALKNQLNNANQKTTTIIQQPPVAYPWYHYYHRYPW